MDSAPRLDPGWTWWMVAFVVVVWLAVAVGSAWLFLRVFRARRRRRASERPGAVRPRPGTELPPGD